MCGITSIIGKSELSELLRSLMKLEYRGYDSWGVLFDNMLLKRIGSISDFLNFQNKNEITNLVVNLIDKNEISRINNNIINSKLTIGIAHTRWATHGGVSIKNTHPIYSNNKEIKLVHNGIIENYLELKEFLINKGFKFYSETDTETIVNLIEYNMNHFDFRESVIKAIKQLKGNFALIIVYKNNIIAVKKGSPLICGLSVNNLTTKNKIEDMLINNIIENNSIKDNKNKISKTLINKEIKEYTTFNTLKKHKINEKINRKVNRIMFSSDTNAFDDKVNYVYYMKDYDLIHVVVDLNTSEILELSSFNLLDKDNNEKNNLDISVLNDDYFNYKKIELNLKEFKNNNNEIDLKGYKHYLLKEIYDQAKTITNSFVFNLNENNNIYDIIDLILKKNNIYFIGSGTSYHSCIFADYLFNTLNFNSKKNIRSLLASEAEFFIKNLEDSVVFVLSQSGETADLISILDMIKSRNNEIKNSKNNYKNIYNDKNKHKYDNNQNKNKNILNKIVSIVNVENSTIDRLSDYSLYMKAGSEISVLSTKSFTSQLSIVTLLFLILKYILTSEGNIDDYIKNQNNLNNQRLESYLNLFRSLINSINLNKLNEQVKSFIDLSDKNAKRISHKILDLLNSKTNKDIFVLGKGIFYPLALESALKIKESSYLHSEGIASGELKHGTIALIEDLTPVIVFNYLNKITHLINSSKIFNKIFNQISFDYFKNINYNSLNYDNNLNNYNDINKYIKYEDTLSNIKEVKSRGAYVIYVGNIYSGKENKKENNNIDFVDDFFNVDLNVVKDFIDINIDIKDHKVVKEFNSNQTLDKNNKLMDYLNKNIILEFSLLINIIISIIPIQLLSYYLTILQNLNPDKPRNLAKSVTVK